MEPPSYMQTVVDRNVVLRRIPVFLLSSHRTRQPYCMETCVCRDIPRQLRCSGDAPSIAHWKSYCVFEITVCLSESRMSCIMFWFILNWFLKLFCHCLTIFPTHSPFSHSFVPCYHFSHLKAFRYLLFFSSHNTYTTLINQWRTQEFFRGRGGLTNSVEDRGRENKVLGAAAP
jgi:hypothetical protein